MQKDNNVENDHLNVDLFISKRHGQMPCHKAEMLTSSLAKGADMRSVQGVRGTREKWLCAVGSGTSCLERYCAYPRKL